MPVVDDITVTTRGWPWGTRSGRRCDVIGSFVLATAHRPQPRPTPWRRNRGLRKARAVHAVGRMDDDDLTRPYDDNIILLDSPVHDGDELIEADAELDEDDVETEQVVLLDTLRLTEIGDLELA